MNVDEWTQIADYTGPFHYSNGRGKDGTDYPARYEKQVATAQNSAWTPLHYAAFYGDAPTVAALLQHGAHVHATNGAVWQQTPLFVAGLPALVVANRRWDIPIIHDSSSIVFLATFIAKWTSTGATQLDAQAFDKR